MDEQQPGQVISPNGSTTPDQAPLTPEPVGNNSEEVAQTNKVTVGQVAPAQDSSWKYNTANNNGTYVESPQDESQPLADPEEQISWTASEFIAHHKSAAWYLQLFLGAILLSALVFFITHDKVSVAVILLVAVGFMSFAGRQPRTLQYRLDSSGLAVGEKLYNYDDFRSFAVDDEGTFSSIILTPLRRFVPPLTIYYSPQDEEKILNLLSLRLPIENKRGDVVDNLMRRIHF